MDSIPVCEELTYLRCIRASMRGIASAPGLLRELYRDVWEMLHTGYYKHVPMELRTQFRDIGNALAEKVDDFESKRFILDQIGVLVGVFDEEPTVLDPSNEDKALSQSIAVPNEGLQPRVSVYPDVNNVADFQDFFKYTENRLPCIIKGGCKFWIACSIWKNVQFWYSFEHRFVPVEIGSYLSEDFEQKLVDLKDFAEYIFDPIRSQKYNRKMYLAQYELLDRFVSLADYMKPIPDAAHLLGIHQSQNLFIGPAGTVTPLHTDPYDNFFCQVIGDKYILLHPPSELPNLYVRSATSQSKVTDLPHDLTEMIDWQKEYPAYRKAIGYEVHMHPGDCLFIPAGWFHFVKSHTPSISVAHFFE